MLYRRHYTTRLPIEMEKTCQFATIQRGMSAAKEIHEETWR